MATRPYLLDSLIRLSRVQMMNTAKLSFRLGKKRLMMLRRNLYRLQLLPYQLQQLFHLFQLSVLLSPMMFPPKVTAFYKRACSCPLSWVVSLSMCVWTAKKLGDLMIKVWHDLWEWIFILYNQDFVQKRLNFAILSPRAVRSSWTMIILDAYDAAYSLMHGTIRFTLGFYRAEVDPISYQWNASPPSTRPVAVTRPFFNYTDHTITSIELEPSQ